MSEAPEFSDIAFVRSVLAASEDCVKILSLDGRLTFMSEGGMRVMEVSDFNAISGCPWPDFWKDQGNLAARDAIAGALEGRSSRFVGMADTLLGTSKWWDVQVSPILDATGAPKAILSVSRDITELKRAEAQAALLAQEMNHRMRNILALVQAIIGQALRGDDPLEVVRSRILERISSIGKAQDVLTQSSWTAAPLARIVETVVTAHADRSRFTITGPHIDLDSSRVLAMALALNELAVNAVKYGALSVAGGHVDIGWSAEPDDGLDFMWSERGGPPLAASPTRAGFGSTLLSRAVPSYFDGATTLDYPTEGLVFRLTGKAVAGPQ